VDNLLTVALMADSRLRLGAASHTRSSKVILGALQGLPVRRLFETPFTSRVVQMPNDNSDRLRRAAKELIPGGVNSPVRAWNAVGGATRFVESGAGARITDVDGRSYLDYVGSWGPLIHGHAPLVVRDAISAALASGTSFGASTPGEVELARKICEFFPSIESVRLVSSGTEATMSALRLARAATRRSSIVKFAGCYHGHSDGLLVRAGSGATTLGVPDSPGVPPEVARLTRVARYNDLDSVAAVCDEGVAAIIVEPVAGNMGVVPPVDGFLAGLRRLADRSGALLIFDEVISGFRLARGGYQEICGVSPDLTCLGKVIGGGLPVGAYGGRADLMAMLAPAGPVYQAGTLSGNPLAVAAGLATLALLDRAPPYERLERSSARLEAGINSLIAPSVGCVQRVGSMLTLFFGVREVRCYEDALTADTERFARFFRASLDEGLWLPPSQFEAWFVSTAHTDEDLDQTIQAVGRALRASDSAGR
jgi:glutamate-1-semialdehyde 2,1-aminomutase